MAIVPPVTSRPSQYIKKTIGTNPQTVDGLSGPIHLPENPSPTIQAPTPQPQITQNTVGQLPTLTLFEQGNVPSVFMGTLVGFLSAYLLNYSWTDANKRASLSAAGINAVILAGTTVGAMFLPDSWVNPTWKMLSLIAIGSITAPQIFGAFTGNFYKIRQRGEERKIEKQMRSLKQRERELVSSAAEITRRRQELESKKTSSPQKRTRQDRRATPSSQIPQSFRTTIRRPSAPERPILLPQG